MNKRYHRGFKTLSRINASAGQTLLKKLAKVSPDMAKFVFEYAFGDIYSRKGLSIKTRELLTIASLTTLGYPQEELKAHVFNALNAGCRRKEIIEVILQMSVYAGFPAAINGLMTAQSAFDENKNRSGLRRKQSKPT